jgi:hypothetical protein
MIRLKSRLRLSPCSWRCGHSACTDQNAQARTRVAGRETTVSARRNEIFPNCSSAPMAGSRSTSSPSGQLEASATWSRG